MKNPFKYKRHSFFLDDSVGFFCYSGLPNYYIKRQFPVECMRPMPPDGHFETLLDQYTIIFRNPYYSNIFHSINYFYKVFCYTIYCKRKHINKRF